MITQVAAGEPASHATDNDDACRRVIVDAPPSAISGRVAGLLLVAGGVLALLGWLLRPVAIEKQFDLAQILAVGENTSAWIWSFRALVFGLFLRLGGLISFGTLFRAPNT